MQAPLAERMRPTSLEDYVGQEHLTGEGGVLRSAIESGRLPSFILWGPPGVGKTTLAKIVAQKLNRPFFSLNAVSAGVKDVREVIDKAKSQRFFNQPSPVLFIDEIHRFNKAQQDALLNAVETGVFILLGATTENPSFEVIPALLSRCQVYILESLQTTHLERLIDRAIKTDEWLKTKTFRIESKEALLSIAGGDARRLYNILELLYQSDGDTVVVTDELVTQLAQQRLSRYDKGGEQHYDIASAMIKSIRGSDPNAALYYMARMLAGGEDVKFVARRLVISAAEDVGLANPNALLMANAAFQAVTMVGMPEARIILSQACIYLATSPKSNAAYLAIDEALAHVSRHGDQPIPLHLRNAPTQLMKSMDYGKGYQYAHDFPHHFVHTEYLPDTMSGTVFYQPQDNAAEEKTRERLRALWKEKYGY